MSWEASAWAKKTRGHKTPSHKLLLMVLADYAHPKDAHAWPSQGALAEDCEVSERTIRRYLVDLEDQGFITTLRKGNQHQPTLYQLNLGVMAAAHRSEPDNLGDLPGLSGTQSYEPDNHSMADAQLGEPDTSAPAKSAGAKVNWTNGASEPDNCDSEPDTALSDEPPLRTATIEPSLFADTTYPTDKPSPPAGKAKIREDENRESGATKNNSHILEEKPELEKAPAAAATERRKIPVTLEEWLNALTDRGQKNPVAAGPL